MTSRLYYWVFSLSVIMGIVLRTVMLLFTIEESSGFIKQEYSAYAGVIIAFLIIGALIIFLSAVCLKTDKEVIPSVKGKLFSVACLLMAIAIIYEAFFSQLLFYSTRLQTILYYAFSVAAAASLCYIGVCKFWERTFPTALGIIPVLFWIIRIITVFTEYSRISTISDTVIGTASMCLALTTFLFYSKVEGKQTSKRYKYYCAVGFLTVYVCLINAVSRIITYLLSFEGAVHLSAEPSLTPLATAFFALTFAVSIFSNIKQEA